MSSTKILDTHIHLWPSTALSSTNHSWMTPGNPLVKRSGISDYDSATSTSPSQPAGFIYVETDRCLPSKNPNISPASLQGLGESDKKQVLVQELAKWAHEPLEELRFLRRIVEGRPEEGDGFQIGDGERMKGCVIWAPFYLATELFELFLELAEQVSGPRLWERVVGFRYLLQGITEEVTLRELTESQDWLRNILRLRCGRGGKGWAFDVGVDVRGAGVWQLEAAVGMIEKIRAMEEEEKEGSVKFVLNHLCKPDLSTKSADSSHRWLAAIKRVAVQPAVYMKFSGGFNQFEPSLTPSDPGSLLSRLGFYSRSVVEAFGPQRVMFGSDWPVCNVGGPVGEQGNWELWRDIVSRSVSAYASETPESVWWSVWWKAGSEAYGISM